MLDLSVLQKLNPYQPPPNPIDRMAKLVALQNAQISGQDMQSQIAERQAQARKIADAEAVHQQVAQAIMQSADSEGNIDWDKASSKVMPYDPVVGQNLAVHAQGVRAAKAAEDKRTQDTAKEKTAADLAAADQQQQKDAYQQWLTENKLTANPLNEMKFRGVAAGLKAAPKPDRFASSPEGIYNTETGAVTTPAPAPKKTFEEQTAASWMAENPGKTLNDYQTMDANRHKSSINVNNVQLTPEGLDAAALSFAKTGIMPNLGMGSADMKAKIINRSAELVPKLDIAANKADFESNKKSLDQAVKLSDALKSFENTALKNMTILESSAKKVVDSGSPLLNTPLRAIDEKALGNTDLPVYRAARQIVVNEVAKLTNNPNLSGQLSDSARKEVSELIPADMTLAQLLNLLPTLRQDMKNRTSSLDDQIGAIRGRISGPIAGTSAKATHRYNPTTGKIEEIK